MAEFRRGRLVHQACGGYIVAEMLEVSPEGTAVAGFCLVGPLASSSIIYATRQQALEALHDIEQARQA